jgi:hypothetical protein
VRSGWESVRHSVIELFLLAGDLVEFGRDCSSFFWDLLGFVRFGDVVVISMSDQKEE